MKKHTVTKEQIDAILAASEIDVKKLGLKTTVMVVTLPSGFEIIASSACVDASNYDEELGRPLCLKRIEDKLWELEGYRLQCNLAANGVCV